MARSCERIPRRPAPKKSDGSGGQAEQALGRSRGGFSTKLHVAVDSLGNPLKFGLSGGQAHDVSDAQELLAGVVTLLVLADKGYDSEKLVAWIAEVLEAEVVIPCRSNKRCQRATDWMKYRERHLVEACINRLKQSHRIAMRLDKLARNYLSFVYVAATFDLLR